MPRVPETRASLILRLPTVSDAAAADFLVTNRVVGIAGLSFGGIALGLGAAAVIGGEW